MAKQTELSDNRRLEAHRGGWDVAASFLKLQSDFPMYPSDIS